MIATNRKHSEQASHQCHDPLHLPLHLLPPEVQLNLLEYLEVHELKSFSETSYHCNTTVAFFLKQQWDMACRTATSYSPLLDASFYRLKGTNFIHRLARLDTTAAARVLLDEHPRNSNSSRSHNTTTTTTTAPSSFLVRFHHNNNNINHSNATAGALRQLLSDGLAAVHEQQRRTAQQLWSHAGAGTVLVLAMAGRLFYQTWHERLRSQHSNSSGDAATTCWYEWHDLSRLAVGLLFAGTVFVGVSKQQQKRRKALRLAAKLQDDDSNSPASLVPPNNMKRSRSVAGNLAAAAAVASPPRGALPSRRSVSVSSAAASTSSLHLSVSMPNLHHMLLHDPDYNDKAIQEEQIHCSSSSSSCHDAKAPEEKEHGALQESLWNVTEDEFPAKRNDPLWQQQQQQQQRHQVEPLSRSGGHVASSFNSLPINKQKTNERMVSETAAMRTPARGCVGVYQRAVADAKSQIVDILKNQRKQSFEALSSDRERADLSTALIDSCTDDASLDAVRIMARRLPLDTFYVGSDNTESCALHTAAFHGACQVLDFLCRGVDGSCSSSSWSSSTNTRMQDNGSHQNKHCYYDDDDGGLCNVNARDANGWTALHFAAGANCPEAVAVLARHGASLNTEARNGYTPLQWALRLQNKQVAEELKRWLAEEKKQSQTRFWGVWRQRWMRLVGRGTTASTRGRAN